MCVGPLAPKPPKPPPQLQQQKAIDGPRSGLDARRRRGGTVLTPTGGLGAATTTKKTKLGT